MNKKEMIKRLERLEDEVHYPKKKENERIADCPKCKHPTFQYRGFLCLGGWWLGATYDDWQCLTCGSKLKEETKMVVIDEKR